MCTREQGESFFKFLRRLSRKFPVKCLGNARGKERGQQARSVCLIGIFTEVWHVTWAIRHVSVCNVTWLHSALVGYLPPPPQPRLGRACTRAFWPKWDWHGERPQMMSMATTYCMWAMIACSTLTALGGRGHLIGLTAHRLCRAHTLQSAQKIIT
jgi:hypothetical protein